MRVGVDGRSLAGAGRGVAHYTAGLLDALAAAHPQDEYRVLVPGEPGAYPALGAPNVAVVPSPLPGRALFAAGAATGRPRVDRLLGGVDVLWAPAPAPLGRSGGVPLVLTVHDLSWVQRPGDFTRYERAWHALARPGRLARAARRVLAVSQATRAAATALWRLDPARVAVVAPPIPRRVPAPGAPAPREPYVLFVGALEPRKAPDVLVEAHRRAQARGLRAELVVVGDGRLAPQVRGAHVHRVPRADPGQLAALYAGALAVAVPSRGEGFGYVPLEALAQGTPSVVSDLPVFAETVGPDGALRVRVDDPDALAGGLLALQDDPARGEALVAAGRAWSARLTPEASARDAHAVLAAAAAA